MLVGWGMVEFGTPVSWIPLPREVTTHDTVLDDTVRYNVAAQLFTVYRSLTPFGAESFLSAADKVGTAVLVNADGWLVMPALERDTINNGWRVLGSDGHLYTIERNIPDLFAQLVYIHLVPSYKRETTSTPSQELRRAAPFADELNLSDSLFVHTAAGWVPTRVQAITTHNLTVPHLDNAPGVIYRLSDSFNSGDVVITAAGELVGFIENSNRILPLSQFANALARVVTSGNVQYSTLGVEGWFSEEQPIIIHDTEVMGFMVSKTLHKNTVLRRGDVIREINGQPATNTALQSALQSSDVRLTVWRAGAIIQLLTPVLHL